MRVIGVETFASVQDWPGRVGYRNRGVSPSGAVDDIACRGANLLVGNTVGDFTGKPVSDACIEISGGLFEAAFTEETVIAVTGADMGPRVNGVAIPLWETIRVHEGDTITFGPIKGRGFSAYLANAGGIDVPVLWGSRSTCVKEYYGGFNGRPLKAGDVLPLGKPKRKLSELEGRKYDQALLPPYDEGTWRLRATPGPRTAPDYFTEEGMDRWFSQPMQVDHNSSRYAYRLRNEKPIFSRSSGGVGGVHPSNVILETYRDPGCLNVCGDFAIILFRDCVAMGGYTCTLTIINADLWKLGQVLPLKDYVQFVYCTPEEARQALIERDAVFDEGAVIERSTPFVLQRGEQEKEKKLPEGEAKTVLSPMVGLVARVVVNEGDAIKQGDIVAVLNVMKTEINVASHEDGKVKEILVEEWDEMDAGTPMIILE